jgi:hypothetical protein
LEARAPFFVIATYTAASRIIDNKHWASDVVMGAFMGMTSGRTGDGAPAPQAAFACAVCGSRRRRRDRQRVAGRLSADPSRAAGISRRYVVTAGRLRASPPCVFPRLKRQSSDRHHPRVNGAIVATADRLV